MNIVHHAADHVKVCASIDPDLYSAGAYASPWVLIRPWQTFLAVASIGAGGGTQTFTLQRATNASGSGIEVIPGTTVLIVGSANSQHLISLQQSAAVSPVVNFTHIRVSIITSGIRDMGAVLLGVPPQATPVSEDESSTVVEVVRV